ncbi:hypothetical protein JK386_06360 [Nocardioides sp. zg-536]|uniref:Uncharacterized protein n=1 Tax=Nocardioides faecalis TaxID=2803858 RepID=A0A939BSD2_9ACTN|nr:hypothetical protein [Nocardioides faecalis]MBM9459519.1 hypothetical protein [Nocardioides faecalis]QVI58055.1 hypothetical protein KG111_13655 [Nocardioides faecalis]
MPRQRNLGALSALACLALVASGCDLSDGARPGLAAEVAGEQLELSTVDAAVQDYCAVLAEEPRAEPVPTASLRSGFALAWLQAVAVENLAAQYDVPLPPDTVDGAVVRATWGLDGQLTDENRDTFEWLTWIELRLDQPVQALGTVLLDPDGVAEVPAPQAFDRGIAEVRAWLDENAPVVNPVFGEYDDATGRFDVDLLSVPVSDEAGAIAEPSELTAAQVAALPADQRCGPAPVPPA